MEINFKSNNNIGKVEQNYNIIFRDKNEKEGVLFRNGYFYEGEI